MGVSSSQNGNPEKFFLKPFHYHQNIVDIPEKVMFQVSL